MPKLLFLIGARAAGKTSCGQALARRLGLPFFDTDAMLQAEAGLSVAEIVEREGWPGFRRRESETLRGLAAKAEVGAGSATGAAPQAPLVAVAATGGGIVLSAENRALLRRHGLVIFLDAPAKVLAARLEAAPEAALRPALTALGNKGQGVLEEVRAVLAERRELYLESAHRVVDAARSLEEVVGEVVKAVACSVKS